MTLTFYPATAPQLKFIATLSDQREVPVAGKDEDEAFLIARHEDCFSGKDVTKQEASRVIDWLKTLPKTNAAPAAPAPVPVPAATLVGAGIYLAPNGDIIKVKQTKDKQRVYAQVMVAKSGGARINLHDEVIPNFDFVYTPGLIQHITPSMKLTLEEAQAFYTRTGRCMNCKKELKVAKSIEKGLGPVCAKMFA